MRNLSAVLLLAAVVCVGLCSGVVSAALQQSDLALPRAFAAAFGLVALLGVGCPAAMAATWVVDRVQRGRMRTGGCI